MDDFLVRALIAGLIVATMAGPLGCFVVWRRMAYFGDALAHATLLGVAFSLWLSLDIIIGLLAGVTLCALTITVLQNRAQLGDDTLLGIVAHAALACGLIAVALVPEARLDLMAYLFGDILAVSTSDLYILAGGCGLILATLFIFWRSLLFATISPDMAHTSGVNVVLARFLITVLVAVAIALSIKIIGVLLITALLIIPAAAARSLATSPERMATIAVMLGMVAVGAGLILSNHIDSPTGPSIVVAAVTLFLLARLSQPFLKS